VEAIVTFSVNTKALVGLPRSLDRRTSDLTAASIYVADYTSLEPFGLADILGEHERAVHTIEAFLDATRFAYPVPDADRLRAVIKSYQTSDLRASQRADAAIAGLPSGLAVTPPLTASEYGYGPAIFDDRREPASVLVPPSTHLDDFPYRPSISDALSPTTIVRDGVWELTSLAAKVGLLDRPVDFMQDIVRPFVGDWAGLLRCADVYDNLALMVQMSRDCVEDVAGFVPIVWTGNVAGMCSTNLHFFSTDLDNAIQPLTSVARIYRKVATGVRQNANLAITLATTIADMLADGLLDMLTEGWFAAFELPTDLRNFVKVVGRLVDVANAVFDIVSSATSITGVVMSPLGVLSSAGRLPSLYEAAGQIPIPTPTGR
jgi:hypothetical protein